jgi:uncharacterized Zn ribbon protein
MSNNEKKGECELYCPKCKKLWASLKFGYDTAVKASDVTVLGEGDRKALSDGDSLACSKCSHEYTNWDVMLAIAEHGKQND